MQICLYVISADAEPQPGLVDLTEKAEPLPLIMGRSSGQCKIENAECKIVGTRSLWLSVLTWSCDDLLDPVAIARGSDRRLLPVFPQGT